MADGRKAERARTPPPPPSSRSAPGYSLSSVTYYIVFTGCHWLKIVTHRGYAWSGHFKWLIQAFGCNVQSINMVFVQQRDNSRQSQEVHSRGAQWSGQETASRFGIQVSVDIYFMLFFLVYSLNSNWFDAIVPCAVVLMEERWSYSQNVGVCGVI